MGIFISMVVYVVVVSILLKFAPVWGVLLLVAGAWYAISDTNF